MSNGDGVPSAAEAPIQPGFRGAAPVAFRIDSDGVLRNGSDSFPAPSQFVTSATPLVQLQPSRFNAPAFFDGQSKPSAFCNLGLAQFKALTPMTTQLTWSITYSLLSAANQNISSQDIDPDGQDAAKLSNIPLPGGRGQLLSRMYAYVGGEPGKTFAIISNTLRALQGIAGSSSAQALLTMPAADVAGISQAEALFQQILQGFAPPKWTQQWMDATPIAVATTQDAATANSRALKLANGMNLVVIVPAESNPVDHATGAPDGVVDYLQSLGTFVGKSQFQFNLAPNGVTMSGGTNPFDSIPYLAMTIEIDSSTT